MQDKKAISTVFATMLLIVLVLVAIVIIWALVRPALLRTGEETELKTLCLSADLSIERAWNKTATTAFDVTIARGSNDINITGVQIIYGDSSKIEIGAPDKNGVKTYSIVDSALTSIPATVKIAPQVKTSKGTISLCDIKDEKPIEK